MDIPPPLFGVVPAHEAQKLHTDGNYTAVADYRGDEKPFYEGEIGRWCGVRILTAKPLKCSRQKRGGQNDKDRDTSGD